MNPTPDERRLTQIDLPKTAALHFTDVLSAYICVNLRLDLIPRQFVSIRG
jgi:hypothetical protein